MDEFTELITEEETSPPAEEIVRSFATIGEVFEDGVSLIFDGEDTPTEKHYLCNTNVFFRAGDRVRILPDSGTYIVEYVVGAPRQEELRTVPKLDNASSGDVLQVYTMGEGYKDYHWWPPEKELPAGGSAGQILTQTASGPAWADGAVPSTGTTGYLLTKTASGYEWQAVPVELPSGGSTGQVLTKTSSGVAWDEVPGGVPSGGTTGYVLTKTSTGYAWQAVPTEIPTSGTTGYVLTKTSTGYAWQAVPTEIPSTGTTGYVLTKTASGFAWQAATSGDTDRLYVSSSNYITLNSSHALVPHAGTATYGYSLGSSSLPFWSLYLGGGTIKIGSSGTTTGTQIGFYGATPTTRKTLITTSANQGYTSATSSNYLNVLNNIAGILKTLGLLAT